MLAVDASNVTRCRLKLDGYTVESVSVHDLWWVGRYAVVVEHS